MRITYIGHATLLLEMAGVRLLTDPNFDGRLAGVLPRVAPPGIALEALPPLDALLLTHAHVDHLSFATLARLPRDIPLYAPPALARWLVRRGYRHAVPFAPGERVAVGPLTLSAAAARHPGARYGVDRWRGASNMYLMDDQRTACLFAGDTALTPETHRLVARTLGAHGRALDVALLPIGYAPWWKRAPFRRGHLTPEDALALFEGLGARYFIPYHWGTFRHVTSGAFDAIQRLRTTVATHARRDAVRIIAPGEAFHLDAPAHG